MEMAGRNKFGHNVVVMLFLWLHVLTYLLLYKYVYRVM